MIYQINRGKYSNYTVYQLTDRIIELEQERQWKDMELITQEYNQLIDKFHSLIDWDKHGEKYILFSHLDNQDRKDKLEISRVNKYGEYCYINAFYKDKDFEIISYDGNCGEMWQIENNFVTKKEVIFLMEEEIDRLKKKLINNE